MSSQNAASEAPNSLTTMGSFDLEHNLQHAVTGLYEAKDAVSFLPTFFFIFNRLRRQPPVRHEKFGRS